MSVFRTLGILILLLPVIAVSGEYADAFMLASLHPQVQSMGFSSVALPTTSGYALNNPAGLGVKSQSSATLVYQDHAGLSNNLSAELVYPLNPEYIIGVTVIHSGVDGLIYRPSLFNLTPEARRDSVRALQNTETENIPYREDAVYLSAAREFEFTINLGWKFFKIPCRLPLGASIKYIDKLLEENRGLGTGIDLGAQLYFDLGGMTDGLKQTEFSIGLNVTDILNSPVYWSTEHQDAIKRNLTVGFGVTQNIQTWHTKLTLSTSTHSRFQGMRQYGMQINVKELVYLRGGHDGETPSFGLGIAFKKFIIGYTFSHHELAEMQKIGINYQF
ncbi:MAG: hypothetical protein K9M49_08700 [Candidatus Marinimicrobia bacterium]|nr:hypothetical protein [Candidatus Neomarinimicrobiota bacterium]MCF7851212.1 hypothetical protein [Candidatus Neomarinimicrobiota bacterium]MCF7905215.1 hypothetical protein [Candidatus Neomarinimicrobiota bacterium]